MFKVKYSSPMSLSCRRREVIISKRRMRWIYFKLFHLFIHLAYTLFLMFKVKKGYKSLI